MKVNGLTVDSRYRKKNLLELEASTKLPTKLNRVSFSGIKIEPNLHLYVLKMAFMGNLLYCIE
jgi:hypothetical protein